MTTAKAFAGILFGSILVDPPKYFSQRAISTFWPALYLTNLNGPLPIGFLPKSISFWAAAIWSIDDALRLRSRSWSWVKIPWA
jgi:hypothetical protein